MRNMTNETIRALVAPPCGPLTQNLPHYTCHLTLGRPLQGETPGSEVVQSYFGIGITFMSLMELPLSINIDAFASPYSSSWPGKSTNRLLHSPPRASFTPNIYPTALSTLQDGTVAYVPLRLHYDIIPHITSSPYPAYPLPIASGSLTATSVSPFALRRPYIALRPYPTLTGVHFGGEKYGRVGDCST